MSRPRPATRRGDRGNSGKTTGPTAPGRVPEADGRIENEADCVASVEPTGGDGVRRSGGRGWCRRGLLGAEAPQAGFSKGNP
jgi:hypothetical protein